MDILKWYKIPSNQFFPTESGRRLNQILEFKAENDSLARLSFAQVDKTHWQEWKS